MRKSESISKLAADLLKSQREMGDAVKGTKNPFFKSTFADLNSVREASIPVLNKHNISVFQPTVQIDGKAFVETLLLHESGEWIAAETEIVYAKQGDPQGQGSGISYARRYGLQSLVNIGAVDDDGETAMGRGKAKPAYVPPATIQNGHTTTVVSAAVSTPAVAVTTAPAPATNTLAPTVTEVQPLKTSNFRKAKAKPEAETKKSDDGWDS